MAESKTQRTSTFASLVRCTFTHKDKVDQNLICKNCGGPRDVGRRLCRSCNLDRLKAIARSKPRYTWDKQCEACKKPYKAWRKLQRICSDCYKELVRLKSLETSTNNYEYTNKPGLTLHRCLTESILGRKLLYNEVVHHMDNNPKNNSVENLVVMTKTWHNRLHQFLDLQRVIFEKSKDENSENCWKTLIVPMTTTWLETTGVTVQKLWEIGQSAAEPHTGEGSETMH